MKCKDFQNWLLTRDGFSNIDPPEMMDHLKGCDVCKRLYTVDNHLEKTIESAFFQQELPKGLYDQIELRLGHAKAPSRGTNLKIAGLVGGLALICVVVFMIFNTPFRYESLQQLTENAVDRHLKGDMTMSFSGDEIAQAQDMLTRELKFNVCIPDLKNQGYLLRGGRLCFLGKCRIAYFFYKKQDKTCSLFIMDENHLNFKMAEGSRFSNIINGCHTDLWKEKGQVYAMVY